MNMSIGFANWDEAAILTDLINQAYRGETSWTTEHGLITGARVSEDDVRQMILDAKVQLLVLREGEDAENQRTVLGCIAAQEKEGFAYLGMFAMDPERQNQGLGKGLLAGAEHFARGFWPQIKGCKMTVITARDTLIAYYVRRGYQVSDELEPFPSDESVGQPQQELQLVTLYKYFL
ncbi:MULTISPECIES: GNAT family N-acetyltransferase [Vitreoscilla]|uniref:GNAT family N-acetyltransferase n=1 Tax=Vitreoscilla stercoraria TaxID=61 RepID=A0ABY4ECX6_VITST|nr:MULTISPECIES: GNAT family N-acetyltransferase [Vitreoscilla]AUZ04038.2 acyl-CoA N-acyltransferase [Vitreoscilla sp. C1]UOO93141.1 GNAT family N-acetyltransferase [Vitreoscilla stercoraria]